MLSGGSELGYKPCICMLEPLDVRQRLALAEQLDLIADHIRVIWREAGYLRLAAQQLRRPPQ